MPGLKTNERPGTRAVLRYHRSSATKVRQVLNLVRGQDVDRAQDILRTCGREAAGTVAKVLDSAVANAVHNDGMDADDLYVASCFADEGTTLKRWRPRARGRAGRIRKRTCHITVIVDRMPDERLERRRAERTAAGAQRSRRVAESRRRADLAGRLGRRRVAAAEREAAEAAEREAAEREAEEAAGQEAAGATEDVEPTEDTEVEASAGADDEDTEAAGEAAVAEGQEDDVSGAQPGTGGKDEGGK